MAQPDFDFPNQGVTYEVIDVLSRIDIGDHICFFKFPYYNHAIVIEKDVVNQTLQLIKWSLSKRFSFIYC